MRSHLLGQLLEALARDRPAGGEGQLGRQLDHRRDPLRLARAVGVLGEVGHALARVGVAPAHRQLGQHGLREQLDDRDAPLDLARA